MNTSIFYAYISEQTDFQSDHMREHSRSSLETCEVNLCTRNINPVSVLFLSKSYEW